VASDKRRRYYVEVITRGVKEEREVVILRKTPMITQLNITHWTNMKRRATTNGWLGTFVESSTDQREPVSVAQ